LVGWLVGCSKVRWGEAAPAPVRCNGRKGYERRNRGKEGGEKKSPNTIPKTKQKNIYFARAGQMESLVGFRILLFSFLLFLLEYCSVIWFLGMGQRIG